MVKSLYIHYPYCKHLCHYCDFYKNIATEQSGKDFINEFRSSLKSHQAFLKRFGIKQEGLETVYMGGGTPSLLGKNFPEFLKVLKGEFDLSAVQEFSLEVDPGTCEISDLQEIRELGVNRMSLGVQSFDPLIQPYLDRSHNAIQIQELLAEVKNLELNFSVDFMLGLAHPSYLKRNIKKELDKILKFHPNHISLYILSVADSYPFRKWLPSDEKIAQEYQEVHSFLTAQNFTHYEVSNYSLEKFESQHNWKYWNQESYFALGASATGLFVFEEAGIRYKWTPQGKITTEELSLEQLKLEKLYTCLRTRKGVSLKEFSLNEDILTEYCSAGYGEMVSDCFRFTPKGWLILDSLVDKLL